VMGYISNPLHLLTKKGEKYGRFVLNDFSGFKEIFLWKEDYVRYGNFLSPDQKIVIIGRYQEQRYRPGTFEFKIQDMMLMSEVRRRFTKVLKIRMKVEDFNEDLLALIKQNYADNGDCE